VSELEDALAFHVRALGLPSFEREFRFDPERRWRFDLAWPERRIACEVDGGVWTVGRHTRGRGWEADAEKLNAAAALGWRVIRVSGPMVEDGRALAALEAVLR
jgi:very-short-patch-repair endonuclease